MDIACVKEIVTYNKAETAKLAGQLKLLFTRHFSCSSEEWMISCVSDKYVCRVNRLGCSAGMDEERDRQSENDILKKLSSYFDSVSKLSLLCT